MFIEKQRKPFIKSVGGTSNRRYYDADRIASFVEFYQWISSHEISLIYVGMRNVEKIFIRFKQAFTFPVSN